MIKQVSTDSPWNESRVPRVSRAKSELARGGHDGDPHRVVAALSFGFWASLLGPGGTRANCEMTLWRPALRGIFPQCTRLTRRQAHEPLNALRTLRHRIAHHEPILSRNLFDEHKRILEVAG
ncbi:MAG: hypothetical protein OXC53_05940 [Rhodobacteraceae bacterium]|nr:hypothetical protein [Paracoccaceae bacterium]